MDDVLAFLKIESRMDWIFFERLLLRNSRHEKILRRCVHWSLGWRSVILKIGIRHCGVHGFLHVTGISICRCPWNFLVHRVLVQRQCCEATDKNVPKQKAGALVDQVYEVVAGLARLKLAVYLPTPPRQLQPRVAAAYMKTEILDGLIRHSQHVAQWMVRLRN
jgi:hypothetical protein